MEQREGRGGEGLQTETLSEISQESTAESAGSRSWEKCARIVCKIGKDWVDFISLNPKIHLYALEK